MPRFNSIKFYQNRPKIKLVFVKNRQNFRALGAPLPDPRKSPPHCRFRATDLSLIMLLPLLIFMPPEFSLTPDFWSINFYQKKAKIKLFLQKKKIFFERWGLRRIGRSFLTPERAPPNCRFLVTRQVLNVWCDIKRAYFQVVESYNEKLLS